MTRDIVERIKLFNQDRVPDLVKLKYRAMSGDPFTFYRGTCHLFYEDWPQQTPLNDAPLAWQCGDLHFENFGTYRGANRLVYFDINDFDEAVLAPATWDIVRFVTSLIVGATYLKIENQTYIALCHAFLTIYSDTLAEGHVSHIERATSKGMVKRLLYSLKKRKRADFLNKRTDAGEGSGRVLRVDGEKILKATPAENKHVIALVQTWAEHQHSRPQEFFKVLDVAHRVAGTGSLGVERYIVLVEGDASPNLNYLLDLKEERASSLIPYLTAKQPAWKSESHRAVTIQKRFQSVSPDLLDALEMNEKPYLIREMQPLNDRVFLGKWDGKFQRLETTIEQMAQIVAWGQLRSSGRQGSAIADELVAFGSDKEWHKPLMKYAEAYAEQVEKDYKEFHRAYKNGDV